MNNKFINFIEPYLKKLMEWIRTDPNTSYSDWKAIQTQYEKTLGKPYVRNQRQ